MSRGRKPLTLEDLPPALLERNRGVLQAAGFTMAPPLSPLPTPPSRPKRPPATTPPQGLRRLEGLLLSEIQPIAHDHGWIVWHTYVVLGPDVGLHLTFIRDVVIFADVLDEGTAPTTKQQELRDALTAIASPAIETYCWTPQDIPAIAARLTQPRR